MIVSVAAEHGGARASACGSLAEGMVSSVIGWAMAEGVAKAYKRQIVVAALDDNGASGSSVNAEVRVPQKILEPYTGTVETKLHGAQPIGAAKLLARVHAEEPRCDHMFAAMAKSEESSSSGGELAEPPSVSTAEALPCTAGKVGITLLEPDTTGPCYFAELPTEMCLEIFSYFSHFEVVSTLGQVCQMWLSIAKTLVGQRLVRDPLPHRTHRHARAPPLLPPVLWAQTARTHDARNTCRQRVHVR